MASSLAQQLLKSRTPAPQKHKSSFIFDPKHAADYDLDTIFSIAVNGLAELRQIDERFALFEKTLFSDTIKDLDRVLQVDHSVNFRTSHLIICLVTLTICICAALDEGRESKARPEHRRVLVSIVTVLFA